MQISRVCIHAIIKERYFFLKKRNVFLSIGYRLQGVELTVGHLKDRREMRLGVQHGS